MSNEDEAEAAIRKLLASNPDLAAELLRIAGVDVPEHVTVEAVQVDWEELIPKECEADGVVYFHNENAELELAVGLNVQLTTDDSEARYVWPSHIAWLCAEYEDRGSLIMIAPDPGVARWAAEPIDAGSLYMKPTVFGPEQVDQLSDGARRAIDDLKASGAKPREFDQDALAEMFRQIVDDDNARVIRDYVNSLWRDLPDGLTASFTVKGRGPLRTWRAR